MVGSRHFSRARVVASAFSVAAFALACIPSALAAATVTVRVEGESSTLLPRTTVTLAAPEPVSGCPANSVAAAINLAVAGNWDHGEANKGGGDFTQTILGETHAFTHEADTWAEWVNYKWGGGICADLLSNGGEVVMVADHEPEPFFAPTVLPLLVSEAPASAQLRAPFTVKVEAVHTPEGAFAEQGQGTPKPASGVTVSGGGASSVTDASGVATLTLASVGGVTLRATRPGLAPSAQFEVCVHNGNDGNCGTHPPSGTATSTPAGNGQNVPPAPYRGPYAVVASARGIVDSHSYPRRRAPRVLAGVVTAHTTVSSVSIELWRMFKGRCYAYDGMRERFMSAHCAHSSFFKIPGASSFFKVSGQSSFSYLMPFALGRGEYVLDIEATDAAGNHTTLARGSSRIRFYVR
ncbi:MAG TPA: hypothetical protein VGW98_06610 [Solirubrobacteraceae bacterium]|jgi:hypothetical protein|nr:hypothetical protein [Solirubrobacteraceae bacterium]